MSEKREQLEGQYSESSSLRSTWKSFMEHPGWDLLQRILMEQIELRQKAVCLTPINEMGQAFAQEYFKGEFSGISIALAVPQDQLDQEDMKCRTLEKELEVENEVEKQLAGADVSSRIGIDPFGGSEPG